MKLDCRQRSFTSEWKVFHENSKQKKAGKTEKATVSKDTVLIVALPKGRELWKKHLSDLGKDLQVSLEVYFKLLEQSFDFKASFGESAYIPDSSEASRGILFIGLGDKIEYYPWKLLQLGGKIAQSFEKTKATQANFLTDTFYIEMKKVPAKEQPTDANGRPQTPRSLGREESLERVLVGWIMGSFKTQSFKESEKKVPLTQIAITSTKITPDKLEKAAVDVMLKAEAVYRVRDFVNLPANVLTPDVFSKELKSLLEKKKVKTRILDESLIQKEGFGGVWAVGKGSVNPPRFAIFEYNSTQKKLPHIVLIGKGVTFDTGGISIKPAQNMEAMKSDMTGAACVASSLAWAADQKLPIRITCLIPMVENSVGPLALLPGDVYKAWGGKTVEVHNTDAEGRLILGDALAYSAALKPDLVIDVATLTGAATITLGSTAMLVVGNNPSTTQSFRETAQVAGELSWEMPLFDGYKEDLRSNVADIKNISGHREGSSQVAAAFLNFFVDKKYTWLHLDIASYTSNSKWKGPHCPSDSSPGLPTLALTEFLKTLVKKSTK